MSLLYASAERGNVRALLFLTANFDRSNAFKLQVSKLVEGCLVQ